MWTEINLCMPYSFHKLASMSPDCSYLGQLVIIRDIVKGLLTWPYSFDSIEFWNILSMIECIFINGSFSLLWSVHNQLEAFCIADDELSCW